MPPNTTEAPPLAAALDYLRRGWSAIALCPPDHRRTSASHRHACSSPGKAPLGRWGEFQRRLPTEAELRDAWRRQPNANVGVVCGAVSGLVMIDVDGLEGEALLDRLSRGDLPRTAGFATGSSELAHYRLIYALPDGHPCPTVPLRDPGSGREALKVLGNGSQTVMPPSRHASGEEYAWQWDQHPDTLPPVPAPAWLLQLLRDQSPRRGTPPGHGPAAEAAAQVRRLSTDGPINQGIRNDALAAFAGAVRRLGSPVNEIEEILRVVNRRAVPPVEESELRNVAASIGRLEPDAVSLGAIVARIQQQARFQHDTTGVIQTLEHVERREIHWLWPRYFPLGKLTCIDGDGGVGKSTLLIDIAARVSRGDVMPDGSRGTGFEGPQGVLFVTCEDDLEDTVKPRVTAARADQSRVFYMEQVYDVGSTRPRPLTLPLDLPALEAAIRRHRCRLVVIDPILAFFTGDYTKETEIRAALTPLKELAAALRCAIVYVRHLTKGSIGSKASYRGGGGMAFVNAARAAFLVGRSKQRPDEAVLAFTKGNLARAPASLAYVIEGEGADVRVRWLGATQEDADDVASQESPEDRGRAQDATEFLEEFLAAGPVPADEVRQEADRRGIRAWPLRRARERLRVVTAQIRENGRVSGWSWALPAAAPPPPTE